MRKEVLIAIFLGFIIGLAISYGIYTANQALKKTKINQPSPSTSLPSPLPSPTFSLIINEPENNIVLEENEATVSGQTEPEAIVAILAEDQEELLVADKQGFFSTRISLISGLNEIKIIAIDKSGKKEEKIINIVHSKAKIE